MSDSVAPLTAEGVRCSDADRERVSGRLRDAAAEGRLTMDELEDRLTGVYAARYGHQLDALQHDLPTTAKSGWAAVLAMVWAQLIKDLGVLLGRHGAGWNRRRLALSALLLVLVVGVGGAAVHGFGDGVEHHGRGVSEHFQRD